MNKMIQVPETARPAPGAERFSNDQWPARQVRAVLSGRSTRRLQAISKPQDRGTAATKQRRPCAAHSFFAHLCTGLSLAD